MAETAAELIRDGKDVTVTLTDMDKVRFEACELIIKKGLNTFLEVGQALAEIRDNRLYRETHKDWPKYCKDVWDLSKGYANRQIGGYETITLLRNKMAPIGAISETPSGETPAKNEDVCVTCEWKKAMANKAKGVKIGMAAGKCTRPEGLCEKHTNPAPDRVDIILPINEAQTRPLTKLKDPDDQVKAWGIVLRKLNEDPKPKLTAALISKAVKEVKGEVVKRKIKEVKKAVEKTSLLSKQFKNQHQVMLDIIVGEKNNDWATSKRKEVIKWLKALVQIAESDD
ncbi:MAG: hypothetical protein L3J69_05980 [Desulfobacula sp.]|nr:hypothetical protein [Desulfobacula sp.]